MGKERPGSALRQLRALFADGSATGLTDRELLERFMTRQARSADAAEAAEAAFAALVDRHGAMVWGVCRRVLGDAHQAEDAFQATFLILVRKAGSVRVDDSLGRWLCGVAHRVAVRARSEAARRTCGVARVPPASSVDPAGESELRDLRHAIGEELDRLPAKYRFPIELCHLQGLTYHQAARQLDWPVATVKSRLTEGRRRLRVRLAQRGLAPAIGSLGMLAAMSDDARAAVPRGLVRSTTRAATGCAAGSFPATVNNLSEGVLKMMMREKLTPLVAGVMVTVALTAQVLSQQVPTGGVPSSRPREIAAQPSGKPDATNLGDRRWIRSLPGGATIEVIGVSSFPSGPDTWRRPDGTPLVPAPCDPAKPRISGDGGVVPTLVLVRLSGIPEGADHQWSILEARGNAEGPATRDGKPLPGLRLMTALMPAGWGDSSVRFEVASGPWNTVATWGKAPGGVGSRMGPSYIFGSVIATPRGTVLPVTHDIQDRPVRLVAISRDGKHLTGTIGSGTGVKNFQQIVVEFNLPPEQIREFQLQTRPYEGTWIPGIVLPPTQSATRSPSPTEKGPNEPASDHSSRL